MGGFLRSGLWSAGARGGSLLPRVYLLGRQRSRLARFNAQIADALVLTANSSQSRLQLPAGDGDHGPGDAASDQHLEFARALKEMNPGGCRRRQPWRPRPKRIGSDDFDLVVTAVIIQRQVGGNLARILENIAETIREEGADRGRDQDSHGSGPHFRFDHHSPSRRDRPFHPVVNPGYLQTLFIHPLGSLCWV